MQLVQCLAALLLILTLLPAKANSGGGLEPDVHFSYGPAQIKLGKFGTLQLPDQFRLLDDPDDIQRWLSYSEYSRWKLAPASTPQYFLQRWVHVPADPNWEPPPTSGPQYSSPIDKIAAFFWEAQLGYETGDSYDEHAVLDADALMRTIKALIAQQNIIRTKAGWRPMIVYGWFQVPRYDPQSRQLSWAIRYHDGLNKQVEYQVRLLGRHGVLSLQLNTLPGVAADVIQQSSVILQGFSWSEEERVNVNHKDKPKALRPLSSLIIQGTLLAEPPSLRAQALQFLSTHWATLIALLTSLCTVSFILLRKRKIRLRKRYVD